MIKLRQKKTHSDPSDIQSFSYRMIYWGCVVLGHFLDSFVV